MKNLYGQKSVFIKKRAPWTAAQPFFCDATSDMYESKFVLQECTWRHLLLVWPCLQLAIHQRSSWSGGLHKYFNAVYVRLRGEFLSQRKNRLTRNNFSEFFMNTFVFNNIHNMDIVDCDLSECKLLNESRLDVEIKSLCQSLFSKKLHDVICENILNFA